MRGNAFRAAEEFRRTDIPRVSRSRYAIKFFNLLLLTRSILIGSVPVIRAQLRTISGRTRAPVDRKNRNKNQRRGGKKYREHSTIPSKGAVFIFVVTSPLLRVIQLFNSFLSFFLFFFFFYVVSHNARSNNEKIPKFRVTKYSTRIILLGKWIHAHLARSSILLFHKFHFRCAVNCWMPFYV